MTKPVLMKQWKWNAWLLKKVPAQALVTDIVDEGNDYPQSTPSVGKARAQDGTCVVTSVTTISGERCSRSSHDQNKTQKTDKIKRKASIPPLHVRYKSYEEADYVKGKAFDAEVSVNSYIRSATLDHLYTPSLSKAVADELRMVKRQLTGIGINLNQLMHKVNAGIGHTDSVLEYVEIIREPVLETLKAIRQALSRRTDSPMP